MAIDRTGINSLNAGDSDSLEAGGPEQLRLTGDVRMAQKLPPQLEQMIKQYWIKQGGSAADRIEDIPKDFIQEILQIFQQSSRGNTQMPSRGDTQMPSSPERSMSAYGGTARPTYTQSRKQRMAGGGIAQLAKKSKDGTRPGYRGSDWSPGAGSPGTTSSGGNVNTGGGGGTGGGQDNPNQGWPTYVAPAAPVHDLILIMPL